MAWTQAAQDLLRHSVFADPLDVATVDRAMRELDMCNTLGLSEARRFMSLVGVPEGKWNVLFKAALTPAMATSHASNKRYIRAEDLIKEIRKGKTEASTKAKVARERKKLLSTPEAKRTLSYALEHEKKKLEDARQMEATDRDRRRSSPLSRIGRMQARGATEYRIRAEDAYLKKSHRHSLKDKCIICGADQAFAFAHGEDLIDCIDCENHMCGGHSEINLAEPRCPPCEKSKGS